MLNPGVTGGLSRSLAWFAGFARWTLGVSNGPFETPVTA